MPTTELPPRASPRPPKQLADLPRPREPRVFNIRSKRRFTHDRMISFAAHLGRPLSYPERIVVWRIAAIEWELRRQDARLEAGEELSGHAMRARLAAENRLRLDLQALGLKPVARPKKTLAEYLSEPAQTAAPQ
jgi:hypothetical protein